MRTTCLVVVLAAAAAKLPAPPSALNRAVRARGGAGPLSADQAVNLLTGWYALNGVPTILAPSKVAEVYKVTTTPLIEFVAEKVGADATTIAITLASLNNGVGYQKAISYGLVPTVSAPSPPAPCTLTPPSSRPSSST